MFAPDGAGGNRFRAVPERYLSFPDFRLSAAQWDALQIPVSVAFFFLNSTLERVAAFYPSPAGATESLLPLETWGDLVEANPALATLQPDVEAFLVRSERGRRRPGVLPRADRRLLRAGGRAAHVVAGLRRRHARPSPAWRGFFDRVRSRARPFDAGARLMGTLDFEVVDALVEPYAAQPTLLLRLRITETHGPTGARRGPAQPAEDRAAAPALRRRGGEPGSTSCSASTPQWGESLRPFLWTHLGATIPGFAGETDFDLPVSCTYDFEVAAAKYLHALGPDGVVPIVLLFSGTVFSKGGAGFVAEPVDWHAEASFPLPVATWRGVMDRYFPDSGWVRVEPRDPRPAAALQGRPGRCTGWDEALDHLFKEAGVE